MHDPIIYSSQLHGHLTLWIWISHGLLGPVLFGVFEHLCNRNCIEIIINNNRIGSLLHKLHRDKTCVRWCWTQYCSHPEWAVVVTSPERRCKGRSTLSGSSISCFPGEASMTKRRNSYFIQPIWHTPNLQKHSGLDFGSLAHAESHQRGYLGH